MSESTRDESAPVKPGAAAPPLAEDLVGLRVGGCRLEATLGRGAMGTVYRGVQESLARPVAVKILRAAALHGEASLDRFFREARAAARVNHPNVVQVFDAGRDSGVPYIVMELVAGESLGRRLEREGRLSPAAAIELAVGAARGLDAAHRSGLIHRDVKPDNILIAADGTPKLVDFGLTKDLEDSADMTRDGHLLGTPNYMSPEACAGEEIDHRADLYSLGVTLFMALTGVLPLQGKTVQAVLMKHMTVEPPRVRDVMPDVPMALDTIVHRLLRKSPDERIPSAARLLDELAIVRRLAGCGEPSIEGAGRLPPPLTAAELPLASEAPRLPSEISTRDRTADSEGDLLAPRRAPEPRERAAGDDTGIETADETVPGPMAAARGPWAPVVEVAEEPRVAPAPAVDDTVADEEAAMEAASEELAAAETVLEEPGLAGLSAAELVLRAKVHYLRQDWARAEQDLVRAIALAPGDGAAHFALACVLARTRSDDRALDHLERAIDAGFRDRAKILASHDLARLAQQARFKDALARASGGG